MAVTKKQQSKTTNGVNKGKVEPQLRRLARPQAFANGEIHRWYNFVLGFSDTLVSQLMDRLAVEEGQLVLDPFCGTGTTLVESMKRGIRSVGLDASPFSCFVSRTKTNCDVRPAKLLSALIDVASEYHSQPLTRDHTATNTYKYLAESGMIKRGWISNAPLRDSLRLRSAILRAAPSAAYRDLLLLALVANISTSIGNMKFGPEIYCGPRKRSVDVWAIFQRNVLNMLTDLHVAKNINKVKLGSALVLKGDARVCGPLLKQRGIKKIDIAISSPPYPTEHDYTRNTRLELAFLDFVDNNDSLRVIKQAMIRSHTKGIYKTDTDASVVLGNKDVNELADRIARKCKGKTYGFARLYPTVVRAYFGGMKRHLMSVSSIMRAGARYAMVVGDQASYFGTHVPTADLLSGLARDCGFVAEESFVWRTRRPTTGSKNMKEHALILKKIG